MDLKFSIIVPVYNTGQYVGECVQGVTKQTYKNYELFLVDNGSTDNSGQIIDKYADGIRIKKLEIKVNNGISGARNLGLEKASGDYILFLDSDDFYIDKTFLFRLNELLSKTNADLATFKTRAFFEESKKYGAYRADFDIDEINKHDKLGTLKYLMRSGTYESASWDKVVKRSILINNQLYFREGIRGEDVEWFYRVIKKVGTFIGIKGDVLAHRVTKTSTSQQKWDYKIWNDFYTFMKEEYPNIDYKDEEQLLMLGNYANYWYILLGMSVIYENKRELFEKLKSISGYRKINFSKKNKLCNILVIFMGMNLSSKIIYKYLRG